jgi:predicted RNA-binding Zn ribbon-like protein
VPDIEKETEKLLEVAAELRDTIDRLFHAHTLMTAVEYATANEALFAISEHAYVIQSMATDHTCGAP